MGQASDDTLIGGMAAGDPDAAASLVRRHQQRVFGLALAIVGERSSAEDVAQEAFLRAWRHADGFDPRRGTGTAWLLTITRNLALDVLRARRVRPAEPLELLCTEIAAPDVPADLALMALETERVRAALRSLPTAQRRAVILAVFGGRTARELGEIEDIPLGTAKTRIRDGLRRLRQELVVEQARS